MSELKKVLKSLYSCLVILFKYGPTSLKRKIENYKYHSQVTQDKIDDTHIYSEDILAQQRKATFEKNIKISILTPLYNTPENFLIELLESLKKQTYSNWELCLADASDVEHEYVGDISKKYLASDSRIVYKKLDKNSGISGNTNECFKLATGDYIGLLDHDDILHESLFYEIVKRINETNADFLYTDEVKFDGDIHNITDMKAFNFKPSFGVDDLRSHNFICHFTCYKKELLESEPCLYRDEYNGSQDHDMVLRLTEKAKRIEHIAKPLYYWRLHQQSVSMDLNSKPYVVDSAIRAVSAQLERKHEEGIVASSLPFQTIYKVTYPIVDNPLVSIICMNDSNASFENFKQYCINNSSYKNLEFIKSNNFKDGINQSKGKFVMIVSDKLKPLNHNWIEELLMHAQRKDIFMASSKIYNKDYTIKYAGICLHEKTNDYLYHLCQHDSNMDIGYEGMLCHVRNTVSGTRLCMLFEKDKWNQLIDEHSLIKGYEEIDMCLRAEKKGMRNVFVPYSECIMSAEMEIERDSSEFYTVYKDEIKSYKFFNENWEILNLA